MSTRNNKIIIFLGVECDRCVGLTTLPPFVSRLSRQCRIFNTSQPCRPPRPYYWDTFYFFYVLRTKYSQSHTFTPAVACWRIFYLHRSKIQYLCILITERIENFSLNKVKVCNRRSVSLFILVLSPISRRHRWPHRYCTDRVRNAVSPTKPLTSNGWKLWFSVLALSKYVTTFIMELVILMRNKDVRNKTGFM
jgi:hypothetical protein